MKEERLLQCSGPAGGCVMPGEKHAVDTLPVPVGSPGLRGSGDTCSFSCSCANASLGGREQPLAFPSRKRGMLEGNAGYSFGNTEMPAWMHSAPAGLPTEPQGCLFMEPRD